MSTLSSRLDLPAEQLPIAPTAEQWRAMSAEAREALLIRIITVLAARHLEAQPVGRPHLLAQRGIVDQLGQHYSRVGRRIYVAEELAVLYPGEPVFVPDILAVLEVEDTGEEDTRLAWVVAEEGRGLDLVLEVLYQGDRYKDLVRNVNTYARLGIAEYFIYDRLRRTIKGYRLSEPEATAYCPILPRAGRLTSRVLELDLAITEGRLRFFSGAAMVAGSAELLRQLGGMLDELEVRIEQEQARAEQEQARAEQEQARAEQYLRALRRALLQLLEARNLTIPAELHTAVEAQTDPDRLSRWITRVAAVGSALEILD